MIGLVPPIAKAPAAVRTRRPPHCCCRVRQWTADAQTWYSQNGAPPAGDPIFGDASTSYVGLYAALVGIFIILMLCRGTTFHVWALGASQRMHTGMVHNCLYAPLSFFLQNPVGELLVAFTKDQDNMDENLVDSLHYLGIYGLIMLSTVITVSVTIPVSVCLDRCACQPHAARDFLACGMSGWYMPRQERRSMPWNSFVLCSLGY